MTVTANSVNRRVELTVSDEGPGIPQRVQGRIFERFYTAETGGGSGLGLAIARELAQRMQGPDLDHLEQTLHRLHARPARPAEVPLPPPRAAVRGARVRRDIRALVAALAWRWRCSRAAAALRRRASTAAARRRHGDGRASAAAGDRADRRATASTPPRSTARPRPAWSRSARSSSDGARRGLRLRPRHRRQASSPTPTSSPTNRGGSRKPAKAVFVEFPDRNVVSARRSSASTPSPTSPCSKVDPDGFDLHPLELGDDHDLVVGQPVAAIGSPFGEQHSLSVGVISATDRSVESLTQFQIEGAIQTDASINPGNSGGPLLDAGAEVVGINQQIETESGSNSGVGFAVPISAVKRSIAQLEEDGEGRIRLHRRLHPGALPAARREARPRHRLRRPARRSRPRRPGRRGRAQRRRREDPLPGLPVPDRRRRDPLGRRPQGRRPEDLARIISAFQPGDTVTLEILRDGNAKRTSRSPSASAPTAARRLTGRRTAGRRPVELPRCFRKSPSARSPSPTTPTSPARS